MNRNHSALRALLIAAASLLATGAWAEGPNAAPAGKANAADKVEKAADKAEKAADKAAKGVKDAVDTKDGKGKTVEDRAARKAKEHDDQRVKLATTWKGPVSDALRQELRRHAERLARLDRIKVVAETEKDKESAEKVTKLLAKENERHEKWLSKNVPVVGTVPATTPVSPVPGVAADKKEGAQ